MSRDNQSQRSSIHRTWKSRSGHNNRSYRSMRVTQWYPLIVMVLALGSDKNSR